MIRRGVSALYSHNGEYRYSIPHFWLHEQVADPMISEEMGYLQMFC